MRDLTLHELERPHDTADDLHMDQDSFRALYDRTARGLWTYLWRRTGDAQLADDLLQETYYRFLRARPLHENEAHRRNYLFRIASNLASDAYRARHFHLPLPDEAEPGHPLQEPHTESHTQQRTDLARALAKLSNRQRDALWLAYAEGSTHIEIAETLGLKTASVKLILFRARRKLARLLHGNGGGA
jgi:RNA polymerase sigma-70 factor (ECF subfamily)